MPGWFDRLGDPFVGPYHIKFQSRQRLPQHIMNFQRDSRPLFFPHRFEANGERRELVARIEQRLFPALPIGDVHRIADDADGRICIILQQREGKMGKT